MPCSDKSTRPRSSVVVIGAPPSISSSSLYPAAAYRMRPVATALQLTFAEVELRPWRESDVPEIVACCSDDLVAWWLDSIPQPYRVEHARACVSHAREAWRTG